MGVVDGPGRARVAAAGKAEILAGGLTDDLAAGVEDAGHDGRIEIRDVALERRGAVHHRDAGDHDIVLDRNALPRELATRRALYRNLVRPGVLLVVLARRALARLTRILHRRQLVRHLVDEVVGLDVGAEEAAEALYVGIDEREPAVSAEFAHLLL